MRENNFISQLARAFAACLALTIPVQGAERLPEPVRQMLTSHCTDCHDADAKKGGVNLDFASLDLQSPASASLLERMHRALANDEMPPAKKPRLDAAAKGAVLTWLDDTLVHKVPRHAAGLRRLTRVEYENTVGKVFGIWFKVSSGFPADTRSHGFDNIAESLMISPPLLDAYMESAIEVADRLFPPPAEPAPPSRKWVIPPDDLSSYDGNGPSNKMVDRKMRLILRDYTSTASRFAAPASGYYRVKFRASAFRPEDGKPLLVKLQHRSKEFEVPITGTVEHQAEIVLHPGDSFGFTFASSPVGRFDPNVPYEGSREEFLQRLTRRPRLLAAWLPLHEPVPDSATGAIRLKTFHPEHELQKKRVKEAYDAEMARADLDLSTATPEAARKVVDAMYVNKNPTGYGGYQLWYYAISLMSTHFTDGPALDMESIEIEGPIPVTEGARYAVEHWRFGQGRDLQRALLGAEGAKLTTADALDAALKRMLSKIFRRDVEAVETARYRALVEQHRKEGNTLENALHLALRTALVAPQFIYREGGGTSFTDAELAARLSYFLTSLPPDDLLRAAVADGSLRGAGGIRLQAERLLASPQLKDFVTSFVGQWLGTRKIREIMPDASLGAYGEHHSKAMRLEPELVFTEILRDNRPIQDFIAPDFTHTHASVGKQMYGLKMDPPDNFNFKMTRVALPRDGRVGGLLGMSGVMMATANGVDTQPVYRGQWVLETILNERVPPPPDAVPAITPDTTQAKTIRELMAAHTKQASCAGCHRKLDPPGFLLENYDAIGQWRETYPIRTGGGTVTKPGPAVDATATMPDGTQLKDVRDLKSYVMSHPERFGRALTEKLFLYGSGRLPSYAERKQLHAISDNLVSKKGGFRDLLLAIIESEPFTKH